MCALSHVLYELQKDQIHVYADAESIARKSVLTRHTRTLIGVNPFVC